MKKSIFLLVTILTLILSTACNTNNSNQNEEKNTSDLYPMTVVDQAGREVVIEKEPESLVSSYYITTSAFLGLGLNDKIKGIESNPKKRNIYKLCAPELFDVTQVGNPKEFDIEACASINPDLVVLPMRGINFVEPLEELGITVLVVNPESQDLIFEMIQLIGKVTNHAERADKITDFIKNKIEFINKTLEGVDTPLVYLAGNSNLFSTASKGMYQNDQISIAGGKNAAGEIDDTYWVEVSYEQILDWNPEYIIMASDAGYPMEEIKDDDNLKHCRAIENDKVYKIPSEIEAWDSPVPSSFLGVAYISSVLHPELFTHEQYEDMVEEYYETFYGFSYSEK